MWLDRTSHLYNDSLVRPFGFFVHLKTEIGFRKTLGYFLHFPAVYLLLSLTKKYWGSLSKVPPMSRLVELENEFWESRKGTRSQFVVGELALEVRRGRRGVKGTERSGTGWNLESSQSTGSLRKRLKQIESKGRMSRTPGRKERRPRNGVTTRQGWSSDRQSGTVLLGQPT